MLDSQLAQVIVFRGGDAAAVRIPQVGTELAEQFDTGFDRFLFWFDQCGPPAAKFVGVFDVPFHGCMIAYQL